MTDARHGINPIRRVVSTPQARRLWAPPCTPQRPTTIALHGEGRVTVDVRAAEAVRALNAVLVAWNYRTRRADTGGYNCRRITGGTGYSLHAFGICVDINWQSNPYGRRLVTDMPPGMVRDILAISTKNGVRVWEWGGDWSGNKDAMHFEIDCTPADLATGLWLLGLPSKPPPPPPPPEEDDDSMRLFRRKTTGAWYKTDGVYAFWIESDGVLKAYHRWKVPYLTAVAHGPEPTKPADANVEEDVFATFVIVGPTK